MKKLVLVVVLIGFALSLSGGLVLAETHTPFAEQTVPALDEGAIFAKVDTAANWVFTILIVLSVFIVLTAAFQFVTGGPEGIAEARQKLIWAGAGILLALLAKGIPLLIVNVLQNAPAAVPGT